MEEENKVVESPQSVKLSVNAKGLFSGECKVYAPTIEEALKKCTEITTQIETIIREKNGL